MALWSAGRQRDQQKKCFKHSQKTNKQTNKQTKKLRIHFVSNRSKKGNKQNRLSEKEGGGGGGVQKKGRDQTNHKRAKVDRATQATGM